MKRIFSVITVLAMMSMLVVFNVTGAESEPSVELSAGSASCGETIDIYLSISNNPGIISLRCNIEYDESALELCSVTDLGLLKGYTTPAQNVSSPYILRWADSLALENSFVNGNIAKLTFLVKENINANETELKVNVIESRTFLGQKVSFNSGGAVISVKEETEEIMLGDVDGDNTVSAKDINLFKKCLSGLVDFDNNQLLAADVNADGNISAIDLNKIIRYVSGKIADL